MDSKLESLLRSRNAGLERELAAKNRDLAIEASLERVRVVAMGMLKPDDLSGICETMFQELKKLGFAELRNAMIDIHYDEQAYLLNYDYSENSGKTITRFNYNSHPIVDNIIYHARQSNDVFTERVYAGKALQEWRDFRKKNGEADDERLNSKDALYYYFYAIGAGAIGISTFSAATAEHLNLLKRFRNVFDLAYRRYTDIELAIAQAREARIEAALERVRSRTMAMFKSEELAGVVAAVFDELTQLDFELTRCAITVMEPDGRTGREWTAEIDGSAVSYLVKYTDFPYQKKMITAWEERLPRWIYDLKGKEMKALTRYLVTETGYSRIPEPVKEIMLNTPRIFLSHSFSNFGFLRADSLEPLADNNLDILLRFSKVFDMTYTRLLDLQKAEAQAREAQIEAALEKVRSRSLAMHHTEELREVVSVVLEKLQELDIVRAEEAASIVIFTEGTKDMVLWNAIPEQLYSTCFHLAYYDTPVVSTLLDAREKGIHFFSKKFSVEEKNHYWNWAFKYSDYKFIDDERKKHILTSEHFACSIAYTKNSAILISSYAGKLLSEKESVILERFARVFEQAYVRFVDLQNAEAQARESKVEAALERVRSRTLAMRKSDEITQTAAVVFKQLIDLGIQHNRLFIAIVHNDSGDIEFWVTAEDGSKISNKFVGNISRNGSVKKMYNGWKARKKSLTIDMQGKELQDYFNYLGNELKVPFKRGFSQKRRVQLVTYFSQGFIGMASPEPQPEEATGLLERFAGVFNLTYTRFNDLKIAEAHAIQAEEDLVKLHAEKQRAEDALSNLQAAQRQLVQSEKMASLGELTAGIAHEIQNPLNFVNNFSEVNQEMIEELEEELNAGNIVEALAIAAGIKQNEQKINHHGKRADGIVKGMLEHSRSGSGEKQPTDLNALADEFLKLSYHGLRAKDQSFNAEIIKHFDANLPEVNVVQQDIGRALLNLFNNAFYAVNQKAKNAGADYKPKVSVTTLSENSHVIIKVKDNGTGIPDAIKDKIMQPFFTTKPTGEGTGLGLSLSYDIVVKGHGGSIQVSSVEGEASEFVVKIPVG